VKGLDAGGMTGDVTVQGVHLLIIKLRVKEKAVTGGVIIHAIAFQRMYYAQR